MHLTWKQTPIEDDIEFILWILNSDMGNWWKKRLFEKYPEIDHEHYDALPASERDKYISDKLHAIAPARATIIADKIKAQNEYWTQNHKKLNDAFSDAFGCDVSKILNNITGRIGLDPICPRNIGASSFDMFYEYSADYMNETAVHEMTHFVWFHIWHEHFNDNPAEYDSPHIKWILSEMVVDVIVRNSALVRFFGDLDKKRDIVYSYFYDMEVAGRPILETLADMYRSADDITNFMETAYKYVCENEPELRAKIAAAEK